MKKILFLALILGFVGQQFTMDGANVRGGIVAPPSKIKEVDGFGVYMVSHPGSVSFALRVGLQKNGGSVYYKMYPLMAVPDRIEVAKDRKSIKYFNLKASWNLTF